jgi:hypothetical protein
VLLNTYASSWLPALKWIAVIGGVGGALMWILLGILGDTLVWRRIAAGALIVAALSAVAPSAAWTVATAASTHSGSIPTSGPAVAGISGGMGGGPGGGAGGGPGQQGAPPSGNGQQDTSSSTTGTTADTSSSSGTSTAETTTDSSSSTETSSATGQSSTSDLYTLLNAAGTKWSAAVVSSQSAASLILNTDTAVFCIGGWNGSDNNITLAAFKELVSSGQIHYFVASSQGGGGGGNGSGSASEITSWVTSTFTSTTVGGSTVYDLTSTK